MKFLHVAILLVAVLYVKASKEKLEEFAKECQAEHGASDDDMHGLLEHKTPESDEAKCMHACVMKKFGVLGDDAKLVKEAAMEVIKHMAEGDEEKEKHGMTVLEACMDKEVTDDACANAATYMTCFKEESAKLGDSVELE